MEIEGEDGSKSQLKRGFKRDFGRGLGFDSIDQTVSRRHVTFQLPEDETQTGPNSKSRVYFEVIGKNPIWVCSHGSGEIRVFRSTQKGEMEVGDLFCISGKRPVWFSLKRVVIEGEDEDDNEMEREIGYESELAESLETSSGLKGVEDLELEDIDFSDINPVKEFGFLVIGHEFDRYPKQMIRGPKTWNWFLEEPKEESDDDDDDEIIEEKRKKGTRSKRKKTHGRDDDDDWTGESEDDKELITKVIEVKKPKCTTRSKDRDKYTKGATSRGKEEDEDDDEDDETLGGFIVDEEDIEGEEKDEEEEEEEEEDYEEDDDE